MRVRCLQPLSSWATRHPVHRDHRDGLHRISLADVARGNLAKIERNRAISDILLWPSDPPGPEREQLPTRFDACLSDQDGRVSVSFVLDGRPSSVVADSLTDNAYDPDGYRFHDVFHFAYAAVLGWSPVTRSLLRRKRKSDPRVDEVEDGGRAAAIEEGISAMVFANAKRHGMFFKVRTVDEPVLQTIHDMTQHLEVKGRSAVEWEDAILQGFDAWRRVRDAGGGCVHVDRTGRSIVFVGDAPATVGGGILPPA